MVLKQDEPVLRRARTTARVDEPAADRERCPDPEGQERCAYGGSDAEQDEKLPALALPRRCTGGRCTRESGRPDYQGGGGNVPDEERDARGRA